MEFSNRGSAPQTTAPSTPTAAASHSSGNHRGRPDKNKMGRVGLVIFIAALVVLLGAIIAASVFGPKDESKYVNSKKLQAVFLNTGQVYFGSIKKLNTKYFVITNIYYLQTSNNGSSASSANAKTNVTLVKLGCELHEPYDQMVINSDQVTFWENLQDNGQVAQAVAKFQKENPSGKCTDQSSSSSSTSNSVQSANNGNSPSAPATKP